MKTTQSSGLEIRVHEGVSGMDRERSELGGIAHNSNELRQP